MKLFQSALLFTSIFTSSMSFSQDSASVLFIGNSYTGVNNLPTMTQDLATSLGDILTKDAHTPGGATFLAHSNSQTVYNKIASQNWDYVVLQGQSQEPSFGDAQVDSESIPYAKQIADSVFANNFCSEVLMYMTWGRENGDPQWAPISTFDGMNARLRSAYLRISDTVQGSVSPVGAVWKYVRDNHPTINLYAPDGSHPSVEGSYLAACTFYSSIFRKSPVGASYISTLNTATAEILQNAAELVVLDSLDVWNLRPISGHTQAEFNSSNVLNTYSFGNSSTKANQYFWDFGDGNTSNEVEPSNSYAGAGTYTVTLIASSPCDSDTVSYEVVVDEVSIDEFSIEELKLAHIEDGLYTMNLPKETTEIELYSMEGRKIAFILTGEGRIRLDFKDAGKGVYLLKLKSKNSEKSVRLPY